MSEVKGGVPRQKASVLAALASPALPMASLVLPVTIFIPAFYATVIGINLALVGIIFTVVRVADLIFDPLVGGLMDRTRTRMGRFRPWLLAGAPIVMGGAGLLFFAQPGVGPLYLAVTLVVAYFGYSIVILSQMGLGAALSPDYDERSRVFAWWQIFNMTGMVVALMLPPALSLIMPVDQVVTVRAMGAVILILTPITVGIALWRVPDNAPAATEAAQHQPLTAYFKLFKLRSVRVLLGIVLCNGLGLGISSAVFVFFFLLLKKIKAEELSFMLACMSIVSIFCAPLWAKIGHFVGKHRGMTIGGICFALYSVIVALMPERAFSVYAVAALIGGFASCSVELLPRAMMADIADEDRLQSGADRSATLYALLIITHKMGQAVAIGIVYTLLDLIGFNAADGASNSESALFGITVLGGYVPAAIYFAGGILALFYPLTARRHAEIRADLAKLDVPASR